MIELADLLHIPHTLAIVITYGALGTHLFPTVVARLDLTGGQYQQVMRWSARSFFIGCAAFHIAVLFALFLRDVNGPSHFLLHATALPQAIGGPVFVRAVMQSATTAKAM